MRIGGALFAGFASIGWIAQRLLDAHTSVDAVVDSIARHAIWVAGGLFLISLVSWFLHYVAEKQAIAVEPLSSRTLEHI
jgi:hypothetical protein